MEELRTILRRLEVFEAVSADEFNDLMEQGKAQLHSPGDRILRFGDRGEVVCVLVTGKAKVLRIFESGDSIELGSLSEGDLFGEMSLLTGEPTSADIVADEDCQVVCWSQSYFSRFITRNPSVTLYLAKVLTSRLRARQADADDQHRLDQAQRAQSDPYGFAVSDGPRRILVVNCGSSSVKYDVVDLSNPSTRRRGIIEPLGPDNTKHRYLVDGIEREDPVDAPGHAEAIALLASKVRDDGDIEAVGHRVVHGGESYSNATVIDASVIKVIDEMTHLAPLHNPANLAGIKACREILSERPPCGCVRYSLPSDHAAASLHLCDSL